MAEITRRRVLQASGAVAASVALAGCHAAETADKAPKTTPATGPTTSPTTPTYPADRPNIVVILSDDMGYDDLGCWGSEISTPNIDRIGAEGWRFTGMHNNPRCTVTRASLLTGLYPTQTGCGFDTGNYGTPAYQGYLNDECVTMAEAFSRVGYRAAIAGKWNVAPWGRQTPSLPAERGFSRSLCDVGGEALTYFDTIRYLDGKVIGRSKNPDYYFTNSVTGYVVGSIKEFHSTGDPFFIYAAYTAPHYPLQAPEAAIEQYRGTYAMGWDELRQQRYEAGKAAGVIDSRWTFPPPGPGTTPYTATADHAWQAARMEVYAAQITVMDTGVGAILQTLDDLGISDNTVVMFLSDNGACSKSVKPNNKHAQTITRNGKPMHAGNVPNLMPGPSNTFQSYGINWANTSNTPFRMYKRWTEEGGISSPMVVRWPKKLPKGGLDHRFLHVMDLMPTFLELMGADYPTSYRGHQITPTEGKSFAQILAQSPGQESWVRPGMVFWEHMGHRAVRDGDWKIVSNQPIGGWDLYNMVDDRTETNDLSREHPDILQELSQAYDAWEQRVQVLTWTKHGYAMPN